MTGTLLKGSMYDRLKINSVYMVIFARRGNEDDTEKGEHSHCWQKLQRWCCRELYNFDGSRQFKIIKSLYWLVLKI